MIEILEDAEIRRILDYLKNKRQNTQRDLLLVMMLYECGLRLSEVVGLKLADVKLSGNTMKVLGKGNKERVVAFGANLGRLIFRYINQERPEAFGKTDAFFLMQNGKGISAAVVKRLFRNMQVKLDMPRLHPHLLRHTFCTTYLRRGGDIFTLKAMTGHESFQILNMYLHLAKGMDAISNSISLLDNLDHNETRQQKRKK
jgi:site-specific recombinase XerD